MYTTWQNNYGNLQTFEQYIASYPAPSLWLTPRLLASLSGALPQLILEGERGRQYQIQTSPTLANWSPWTNFTATDATASFLLSPWPSQALFFRAACVQ